MNFQISQDADRCTVFLTGEIDLERSPAARKSLLDAVKRGKPVSVDLSGVSYMDSSGIASLIEAYQKAQAAKIEFTLERVGASVAKVLSLARLDKVFTIR